MNDAFIETISQLQMSPHPIGKWSLSSSHSILSLQSLPVPGSPHCLWSGGERRRLHNSMFINFSLLAVQFFFIIETLKLVYRFRVFHALIFFFLHGFPWINFIDIHCRVPIQLFSYQHVLRGYWISQVDVNWGYSTVSLHQGVILGGFHTSTHQKKLDPRLCIQLQTTFSAWLAVG